MNPMDDLRAKITLAELDQLSIENMVARPPRVTRNALHVAVQQASRQIGFTVEDLGRDSQFSTRSEMLIADAINDMLWAAHAKHWKENSP
jgi:hypothetical protein